MVLSFTALTKHGQFRSFRCHLPKIEVALDALSTISSQGDTILRAQLIDEGHRTELPIDAFDGESLSEPIYQLEKQWQAILNQPVRAMSPTAHWRAEMARQQLRIYNQRIDHYKQTITHLEELRQMTENVGVESWKMRLIGRYDALLDHYYSHMEQAKTSQVLLQQKLNQLTC